MLAGGHRRAGPRISLRSDQPSDDQPGSGTTVPAAAEVFDHRIPRAGVQGRAGCAVEQRQAAPFRMAFSAGGIRQPIPAGIHPSGRQPHRAGRRAQTGPSEQQPDMTMTGLRRLLSRKISIEAMLEFALWMAIPSLVIGIGWTFVNADDAARVESHLETRLPAGSELAAFGATTALWPLLLFGHEICAP